MNTKAVSIRVSTVGGKAVVQEFEQIGNVGSRSLQQIEKDGRRSGMAMQNASYQVQDFFVQIAGGTDPMRALGQQLPQLLGGMGLIGGLAGTAVAGLSVLYTVMGDTAGGAEDVTGALDEMEAAFAAYMGYAQLASQDTAELAEKFGQFADQVREFSGYMQDVSLGSVLEANQGVIGAALEGFDDVKSAYEAVVRARENLAQVERDLPGAEWIPLAREDLKGYQADLDEAAGALGLTADQAMQLYEAMEAVKAADGMEETARLAGEALAVMQSLVPLGYELPEPLREAAGALEALSRNAAEAAVETETASFSMQDYANAANNAIAWVSQLTGETDGLAGAAAAAAQNMWDFLGAKGAAAREYSESVGGGRGLGPGGPDLDPYGFRSQLERDARRVPARASGGGRRASGGGGGGSGQSAELREAERLFEATRTEAEQYAAAVEQIDMLLGKGLITQDTYNRALDDAGEKYLDLGDAAKFWEDINQSLKDSILDLGEEGSGAFDDIARSIKRAALEALLFKSGPLAGVFGGGGAGGGGFGSFLSGLLSFEGGGYTGSGPRSGGLDGRGGFLAINHPDETVVDHRLGGGAVGGGMTVKVEAVPNPYFDVRVAQVSAAGDQRAAALQRQALPRMLRDQQARGL